MKNNLWIALFAFIFLSAIIANGQMYTYRDAWFDANGNVVADNATYGSGGYGKSSFAYAHIQMPSGAVSSNTASGSSYAEAVTQKSSFGEGGQGFFSGYNEVSDICWNTGDYSDFQDPIIVPFLQCSSPVTRGGSTGCSVTPSSGVTVANWRFEDGSNPAVNRSTNTGTLTWTGTMVISGAVTVDATSNIGPTSLRSSITVNNRNWHTNPASPQPVPNDTFIHLPVPPAPTGRDSGLGEFNDQFSDPGVSSSTVIGDGPNKGYAYFAQQLAVSTIFQYEINPDLENSGSMFSTHQWGGCGFISWLNLLTQTKRHEFNSSSQSHYAFYTNATNTSGNNPGDFFEKQTAAPGTNLVDFANSVRSEVNARYSTISGAAAVEPFGVNENEAGAFLGDINYAPYKSCP